MTAMTDRLLRRPEVETIVGLGTTTIYKMMNDGRFPRPLKITPHAARWRLSDIEMWLAEQSPA